MVDIVKAKELRLSGMRYEDIANELQCSVAWCKLNLKSKVVKKDKDLQDATIKLSKLTLLESKISKKKEEILKLIEEFKSL